MDVARCFRLAVAAPLATAGILIGVSGALAQSPPAASPSATPPAASTPTAAPPTATPPAASEPVKSAAEEPAKPAAATPAKPADPANPPAATPATPAPSAAEAPVTPAPAPPPPLAPVQTADPFGEETTLEPKTVVILKGKATWDNAFDSLMEAFKSLSALLEKQGITANGNPMIVYTSTDDAGFTFQAEMPVAEAPKSLAKTMSMGKSPDGKALKFVHHGSYDNMDNTYEAITNFLDDKKLEAKDTFIEEYLTDPLKTAEDKLVINVYVPMK